MRKKCFSKQKFTNKNKTFCFGSKELTIMYPKPYANLKHKFSATTKHTSPNPFSTSRQKNSTKTSEHILIRGTGPKTTTCRRAWTFSTQNKCSSSSTGIWTISKGSSISTKSKTTMSSPGSTNSEISFPISNSVPKPFLSPSWISTKKLQKFPSVNSPKPNSPGMTKSQFSVFWVRINVPFLFTPNKSTSNTSTYKN